MPRIEDIFIKRQAALFRSSTLDMSQVYQQLILDEESRRLATVNICIRYFSNTSDCPLGLSPWDFPKNDRECIAGHPTGIPGGHTHWRKDGD